MGVHAARGPVRPSESWLLYSFVPTCSSLVYSWKHWDKVQVWGWWWSSLCWRTLSESGIYSSSVFTNKLHQGDNTFTSTSTCSPHYQGAVLKVQSAALSWICPVTCERELTGKRSCQGNTTEHRGEQLQWAPTPVYLRQKKLLTAHKLSHMNIICGGRCHRQDACSIMENSSYREKEKSIPASRARAWGQVSEGTYVCWRVHNSHNQATSITLKVNTI